MSLLLCQNCCWSSNTGLVTSAAIFHPDANDDVAPSFRFGLHALSLLPQPTYRARSSLLPKTICPSGDSVFPFLSTISSNARRQHATPIAILILASPLSCSIGRSPKLLVADGPSVPMLTLCALDSLSVSDATPPRLGVHLLTCEASESALD